MTLEEALKRVLRSFQTYYNIDLEIRRNHLPRKPGSCRMIRSTF